MLILRIERTALSNNRLGFLFEPGFLSGELPIYTGGASRLVALLCETSGLKYLAVRQVGANRATHASTIF
jgi:hypothetical protein